MPVSPIQSIPPSGVASACLLALALVFVSCGGGPDREEDRAQIEALFERVSSANVRQDARAACEAYSPESLEKAFISLSRCIRETERVFIRSKEAGVEPTRLEVAEVSFLDDRARVELTGRTGEANLVEREGRWYLELTEEPPEELVTQDGEEG